MYFNQILSNRAIFWLSLLSTMKLSGSTTISICADDRRYNYDIEQCPGGIQIRDVNRWFSKSRDQACICGEGAMLQFDGEGDRWFTHIYPPHIDQSNIPVLGSWYDYNLNTGCELIKGKRSGALFINAKRYENPDNFPTRALELLVDKFEPNRVAGSFKLTVASGLNRRQDAGLFDFLKTVMLSTQEPALVVKDPEATFEEYLCAYNTTGPDILLAKYITTTWGNPDFVKNCENQFYKPYSRTKYACPVSCMNTKESASPSPDQLASVADQPLAAFRQLMLNMAEIAIRMKYAEKMVSFNQQNHPYAVILQNSCRVFYRAFPTVVSWETLMNAVTLFGITFEGLVPMKIDKTLFEQMKIMLGRCSIQEMRRQKEHGKWVNELCPSVQTAMQMEFNKSIATVNLTPGSKGQGQAKQQQPKMRIGYGGPHNIVIELLWKIVQFSHASCLSSTDHYPNVHHAYTNAMIEMFSTPAVQLLWYQQGKYDFRQLGKVMIHIFPELPDNALPTMELLFDKLKFHTHFNVLMRPKIKDLDARDMRCAGHGKLIWEGKACCYQEDEDKKFRFFNRVSTAKL